MSDDESRRLILSRRAKFLAAAVAGMIACEPSPENQEPRVCLSQVRPHDDDAGRVGEPPPEVADAGSSINDVPPQPCLSVALPPTTATATTSTPPPQVCLSPLPPPRPDAGAPKTPNAKDAGPPPPPPMPCLSPPRPND